MDETTLKGAWLQVSGRAPRWHRTQGLADADLREELDVARWAGWKQVAGGLAQKIVVVEKDGRTRRMFIERCDADGVKVGGAGLSIGARMSDERKAALLAGEYVTP